MMTGALSGNSGMAGAVMQPPQNNQYQFGGMNYGGQNYGGGAVQTHVRKEVFCSNCSRKFPSESAFCPHCGNKYNPCPSCGADNSPKATRCVTCGAMLVSADSFGDVCPKCHNPVQAGLRFCPTCGNKL